MFTKINNPRWLCKKGVSLEITISLEHYGEVPYVINEGGSTDEEKSVWDRVLSGEFGEIGDVPPPSDELIEYNKHLEMSEIRSKILRLSEDQILLDVDNSEEISELKKVYKALI